TAGLRAGDGSAREAVPMMHIAGISRASLGAELQRGAAVLRRGDSDEREIPIAATGSSGSRRNRCGVLRYDRIAAIGQRNGRVEGLVRRAVSRWDARRS